MGTIGSVGHPLHRGILPQCYCPQASALAHLHGGKHLIWQQFWPGGPGQLAASSFPNHTVVPGGSTAQVHAEGEDRGMREPSQRSPPRMLPCPPACFPWCALRLCLGVCPIQSPSAGGTLSGTFTGSRGAMPSARPRAHCHGWNAGARARARAAARACD